jgi:cytochrome b involved in lipid metabolism
VADRRCARGPQTSLNPSVRERNTEIETRGQKSVVDQLTVMGRDTKPNAAEEPFLVTHKGAVFDIAPFIAQHPGGVAHLHPFR